MDIPLITFDELPVGATVTTQYRGLGVEFLTPCYITTNNAQPLDPPEKPTTRVLSGVPYGKGPIKFRFVVPGTAKPTVTNLLRFEIATPRDYAYAIAFRMWDADGAVITDNIQGDLRSVNPNNPTTDVPFLNGYEPTPVHPAMVELFVTAPGYETRMLLDNLWLRDLSTLATVSPGIMGRTDRRLTRFGRKG